MNKLNHSSMKNAPLRLSKETLKSLRVATGIRTGLINGSKGTSACTESIVDGNCTNMGTSVNNIG